MIKIALSLFVLKNMIDYKTAKYVSDKLENEFLPKTFEETFKQISDALKEANEQK